MSKCIVAECNERCTRFTFPSRVEQRAIWLERSGNKSLDLTRKSKVRICQRHFALPCFLKFKEGQGNLLKKLALPSLFLPDYIPKGEVSDSFLFPTKKDMPIQETTLKKSEGIEMHSMEEKHSPIGHVKIPVKTYKRKVTKIAIPSTSKKCKEEMFEGIKPYGEIMEEKIKIKEELKLLIPIKEEPKFQNEDSNEAKFNLFQYIDSTKTKENDFSEVKSDDYFVSGDDLFEIKKEVEDFKFKSEILSSECDIPTVKNESDLF